MRNDKRSVADSQQYDNNVRIIAAEILTLAQKLGVSVSSLTRDMFLAKRKDKKNLSGFVYKSWGVCKAEAESRVFSVDHPEWLAGMLIKVASHLGIPVSKLDLPTFIKEMNAVSLPDHKFTPSQVESKMAWKDLKTLAARKGLRGPLSTSDFPTNPTVPEDYYVSHISTQLNSDGEVEKQWLRTPLEQAPGQITEQVPSGHIISGVSTLVSGDGRTVAQWVKTRKEEESREDAILRLFAELPKLVQAREGSVLSPQTEIAGSEDLLACYVLGDPHLGLLAWAPETGASFDLTIAERLMCTAVRDLVLRGPRTRKAMLVSLGDLFHADNMSHHTTKGEHALDVDGRMSKVLSAGMTIVTTMIDALLEHHEEVEVDCIQGNHDQYTSLVFAIALSSYYRNEPRIKIPVNPAARHYHKFGRNLIGCVHGDSNKLETLGEIMATEEPQAWGATDHRTWFVGHVHHSQVKELRGCTVETFRTLAARDSWHAKQGYSSQRDLRRIVYHSQYGEISREVAGLQYLESLMPKA